MNDRFQPRDLTIVENPGCKAILSADDDDKKRGGIYRPVLSCVAYSRLVIRTAAKPASAGRITQAAIPAPLPVIRK